MISESTNNESVSNESVSNESVNDYQRIVVSQTDIRLEKTLKYYNLSNDDWNSMCIDYFFKGECVNEGCKFTHKFIKHKDSVTNKVCPFFNRPGTMKCRLGERCMFLHTDKRTRRHECTMPCKYESIGTIAEVVESPYIVIQINNNQMNKGKVCDICYSCYNKIKCIPCTHTLCYECAEREFGASQLLDEMNN